jgi:predicted amidohydrolase
MRYLAAVVQLTSTPDVEASLAAAEAGAREAAGGGAKLVCLPENTPFLGPETEKARHAEPLEGPRSRRLARLARELGVYLAAGTVPERSPDPERPFNTALLFGPDGELLGSYRKIHLFDVDLGPDGPHLRESRSVRPGTTPVVVDTPLGRIGLSICYDLRFPELYRSLSAAGAELLLAPSAFTVPTGADHWEVLLRARAIENQAYVVAAAQIGRHTPERRSYGRSLIVDPWGVVLSTCPDRPSVSFAEVDLDALRARRRAMPCLEHRSEAALREARVLPSAGPDALEAPPSGETPNAHRRR